VKKVLFVIPTMLMGGAEKSLVSLLQTIDKTNYKIDVLLFSRIGPLLNQIPEEITVYEIDEVSKAMILEFRKYFKTLLKPKGLSAAMARLTIFILNSIERKTGKVFGLNWILARKYIKPFYKQYDVAIGFLEGVTDFYVVDKVRANRKVGWIHTDLKKAKINQARDEQYYQHFDALATISDHCLESFHSQFPSLKSKIQVIKNIVPEDRILLLANEKMEKRGWGKKINLVTIGRLDHVKGIDLAINACDILIKYGYEVTWHVYGEGNYRNALQDQINQLGIHESFILEGMVPNPYPYIKNADIIVQTSRFEGKSLVLDEAKILGKPIVSTNYPTVFDQIRDKVTGVIVDMTAESIAAGIEQILSNNELKETLIANCLAEGNESEQEMEKVYRILVG
jgi:glycosyltransferase involved in cell wall biosynthesis